jgi:hypothetical protein
LLIISIYSKDISSKYEPTIFFSNVLDEKKGIKYQYLKDIVLSSRNVQTLAAKRNQKRKELVKKQFNNNKKQISDKQRKN